MHPRPPITCPIADMSGRLKYFDQQEKEEEKEEQKIEQEKKEEEKKEKEQEKKEEKALKCESPTCN